MPDPILMPDRMRRGPEFQVMGMDMLAGMDQVLGIADNLSILTDGFAGTDGSRRYLVSRRDGLCDFDPLDPASETEQLDGNDDVVVGM